MIDIVVMVMKFSDGVNAVCGEGWVASINNISRAAIEGDDIMIMIETILMWDGEPQNSKLQQHIKRHNS